MRKEYVALVAAIVAGVLMAIVGFFVGNNMSKNKAVSSVDEAKEEGTKASESVLAAESKETTEMAKELAGYVYEPGMTKDDPKDLNKRDLPTGDNTTSTTSKEPVASKEPDDPYGMYRVSEEWLSEDGGIAVERDGHLYLVIGRLPEFVIDQYNIGYANGARGTGEAFLYMYDFADIKDLPTEAPKTTIAAGDFPIISLHKNDVVRVYSDNVMEDLPLVKADFFGYTIQAIQGNENNNMYAPVLDHIMIGGRLKGDNVGVFDVNDSPVEDVHNLVYGQDYRYEWYEGTQYQEMTLPADSRCYVLDNDAENKISVELTKDGYAIADFSGLEPGIYATLDGLNVFEVTD